MVHLSEVRFRPESYPTRSVYPFHLPVFQTTPALAFPTPITLFVGENGTGKSTLLEAIARRCDIHIWDHEEVPHLVRNRYQHEFHRCIDVQWTNGSVPGSYFAAQIFREFTELLDTMARADPGQLRPFGGKSLVALSHGQSLMSYFAARYRIMGLYLLDEPETALSPKSQLRLARLLGEMGQGGHAQFILCTHSPILLACPGATLYSFDESPIRQVCYEDTEHYQVYKEFMADPAGHLGG